MCLAFNWRSHNYITVSYKFRLSHHSLITSLSMNGWLQVITGVDFNCLPPSEWKAESTFGRESNRPLAYGDLLLFVPDCCCHVPKLSRLWLSRNLNLACMIGIEVLFWCFDVFCSIGVLMCFAHLVFWCVLLYWCFDVFCSIGVLMCFALLVFWCVLLTWCFDVFCSIGVLMCFAHLVFWCVLL